MALDKNALGNAIRAAFDDAKEQAWETPQIAAALAQAIDAYVRAGVVSDVKVEVELDAVNGNPATGSGKGTQTGSVHLK